MRKSLLAAAAVLALASTLAACDDYLTGPELTEDPNLPPAASTDQLYHAVQLTQFIQHTGDLARHASMWMQQMAGIGNQLTGRGRYIIGDQDLAGAFDGIYLGGGLLDLREIQNRSEAAGDRIYAGIAKVWEAYLIGEAASLWGAIPYSEAVTDTQAPALDAQEQVYAAVQSLLDEAIADLNSGEGSGPGAVDLPYGGDPGAYRELAWTLKARFYMHWVEAQNTAATQGLAQTACGGDCVVAARAAAMNGISSPANDFRAAAAANPNEENLWYQFMFVQRQGQISAGKRLVDLMQARSDPRLTQYFAPTASGTISGSDPGGGASSLLARTGPGARGAPDFRQPMVTYAENELILAEAEFRLGNPAVALTHLNNVRTSAALAPVSGLSGESLFVEIMTEKYVALFQNIEVWNDFKRTCTPTLEPATGDEVIGRLLYSDNEKNTNPNVRAATEGPRNANDPQACPVP